MGESCIEQLFLAMQHRSIPHMQCSLTYLMSLASCKTVSPWLLSFDGTIACSQRWGLKALDMHPRESECSTGYKLQTEGWTLLRSFGAKQSAC